MVVIILQGGHMMGFHCNYSIFIIQCKPISITTRLRGINSTNSLVYFPEPRVEVYCLTLNFKISKLGYYELYTAKW